MCKTINLTRPTHAILAYEKNEVEVSENGPVVPFNSKEEGTRRKREVKCLPTRCRSCQVMARPDIKDTAAGERQTDTSKIVIQSDARYYHICHYFPKKH